MTWKRKIVVSLLIGPLLTGTGIGMVWLGGWGPCGPASGLSALGGYLSVEHLTFWARVIPGFEAKLAAWRIPDLLSLIVIPSLDFTLLALISFAVGSICHKLKAEPVAAPALPPDE
jgi:hypothetical protein